MLNNRRQLSRASLMAALGVTALIPVAGAVISLGDDRPPIVVQSASAPAGIFERPASPTAEISVPMPSTTAPAPTSTPSTTTVQTTGGETETTTSQPASAEPTTDDLAVQAFLNEGYSYDDAAELAGYWGMATPYDAKVAKGLFLLGLAEYPGLEGVPSDDEIRATYESMATDPTAIDRALTAYFDVGYDYDQAVWLADCWGFTDITDAKVLKGLFILDEIEFPGCGTFGPSGQMTGVHGGPGDGHMDRPIEEGDNDPFAGYSVDDALDAYFEAGYDYDHAVELADYWGLPSAYEAKIVKGDFILGLIDFPAADFARPFEAADSDTTTTDNMDSGATATETDV